MTDDPLANLRRIMSRRRKLQAQLDAVDDERDVEIRDLMTTKSAPPAAILEVAELKSRQRLYQIRDGNRGHGS